MLGLALRATRTGILSRQLLVSGFRSSARSLFVLSAPRLPQCHNIPYNIPLQPCVILSPKWRWVSLMSTVPQPAVVAEIARGETLADSIPNNVPAQLRLFNLCIKQGGDAGHKVIMSRWERMCEFNPASPLLHSDEAFKLYCTAAVKLGLGSSINFAVQRREQLLRSHPLSVEVEQEQYSQLSSAVSSDPVTTTIASTTPAPITQSTSQQIAELVFAEDKLHTPQRPSTLFSNRKQLTGSPIGNGSPDNPIFVTIQESRSTFWGKMFARGVWAAILFAGFFVVMAVALENTNLLKAGPRTSEFEPVQGKIVKFSDVHGVDEAKGELQEVVDFLKDPSTFTTLGGKLPKGILLTGSPGTGKTMLARAVAGEAGVPFLFASGSEFEEVFVGVGAKRVRELFAIARKKQPAIIFIDELDAIGGKRSSRDQHHLKQTLNQLLVEMDGFLQSEGVIVIAATNFPESLDQALVRPGRFDRIIAVPLPDVRGRVQILQHHMRNVTSGLDVDPMVLARGTPGFSGADLQNMVNQAAIQASKEGAKEVTLKHFEWAKDRIIMGAERRTHYIDPKVKKLTAYHEGGHALVALYTEGAMPLHKVTCVTRGHALGLTQQLPEDDQVSVSKKQYLAGIDVAMGGRAAEELIYGPDNVTSGASSDIRNATSTASAMVRHFGYSDKIGPVFYHRNDNTISPQKREEIESEIQRLIQEAQARAKALLQSKEDELHRLADALVEYETLNLEEIKKVIKGEPIRTVEEKLSAAVQTTPAKKSTQAVV